MRDGGTPGSDLVDLERGRAAFAARAWNDAYLALARADGQTPLGVEDLDRLSLSAALTGRDDEHLRGLERVYQARLDAGHELPAARAALWSALRLFALGQPGQANGWLVRAQRLVGEQDCVEAGYLLLPVIRGLETRGESAEMAAVARRAIAIAERFHDIDLTTFARALAGKAELRQGHLAEGLAFIDEAMLSVTTGELTPIVAGLVYCSTIGCCHQIFAVERAHEWTRALTEWCRQQEQLVTFTGICTIHRVELLQLAGDWNGAMGVARTTAERLAGGTKGEALETAAGAHYEQAEVHRLRGEYEQAEAHYRAASAGGREPQPGLALLRLAQGRTADAAAAVRRVLGATRERLRRVRYLPAGVEIFLAAGELDDARGSAKELDGIAAEYRTEILGAIAAHARAAVAVSEGDSSSAIEPLRRALRAWQQVGAPYIVARHRMLLARACRDTGDHDAAAIERELARATFTELGAAPDLAVVAAFDAPAPARTGGARGLSARELEVLRLVASGKTNKEIAGALHLSEKTVDRHVSNIFTKTNVGTRAAATAFAYQNGLV